MQGGRLGVTPTLCLGRAFAGAYRPASATAPLLLTDGWVELPGVRCGLVKRHRVWCALVIRRVGARQSSGLSFACCRCPGADQD